MRMINLSAFVALVLALTSCNKELGLENAAKETTPAATPASNSYNLKLNGNSVSSAVEAVIAPGSEQLVINAIGSSDEKVSIILPAGIKPGTYDLQFLGDYMATLEKGEESSLVSESGKVTIVERNDVTGKVSGTFAFNAASVDGADKATITDGNFSVVVAK